MLPEDTSSPGCMRAEHGAVVMFHCFLLIGEVDSMRDKTTKVLGTHLGENETAAKSIRLDQRGISEDDEFILTKEGRGKQE